MSRECRGQGLPGAPGRPAPGVLGLPEPAPPSASAPGPEMTPSVHLEEGPHPHPAEGGSNSDSVTGSEQRGGDDEQTFSFLPVQGGAGQAWALPPAGAGRGLGLSARPP